MTYAIHWHQCNGRGDRLRQIDRRLQEVVFRYRDATEARNVLVFADSSVPMASRERVSQNEALHQIAPPAEQAIPIDDMIIRSMTPGNAKGLCVRRETSEASEYRRKCSERNKGPEVAALLLAMAICKAQFYWLHFRPGSQDCATLCFSLSLNILPVVLLTRCSRVHAGQVTASKLSVRSVGAVSGSQT
jgi:hypothetical protein